MGRDAGRKDHPNWSKNGGKFQKHWTGGKSSYGYKPGKGKADK